MVSRGSPFLRLILCGALGLGALAPGCVDESDDSPRGSPSSGGSAGSAGSGKGGASGTGGGGSAGEPNDAGAGGVSVGPDGGAGRGGGSAGGTPSAAGQGGIEGGAATEAGAEGGGADGAADAGSEDGGADGAAGGDVYVSPTGSDDNPGTRNEPFLTISHAVGAVTNARTVYLLDGTFGVATQPEFAVGQTGIAVPADTTLVAVNPGHAVLSGGGGNSSGLVFAGSASVHGIEFDHFSTAIQASDGIVSLTSVEFISELGGNSGAQLVLSGTVQATLVAPPGFAQLGSFITNGVADVRDSAELSIVGGSFTNTTDLFCEPGCRTRDQARLTLTDVLMRQVRVEAYDTSEMRVTNSRIEGRVCPAATMRPLLMGVADQAKLVATGSEIVVEYAEGIYVGNPQTDAPPTGAVVTLIDSSISGVSCYHGIYAVGGSKTLTLQDSSIACDVGAVFSGGTLNAKGLVSSSGAGLDLRLTEGTAVTVRGSIFYDAGIFLDVNAVAPGLASLDLGTFGSPGGNVMMASCGYPGETGNGPPDPGGPCLGLWVFDCAGPTPFVVSAVGNKWWPSQGADPEGLYFASGIGGVNEIVGPVEPVARPENYNLGAQCGVRLAENP